jgi:hypothetical protein
MCITFFLIRKGLKNNTKVHYYRIGISLQALYITLLLLLKDNMINHIFLVGMVRGIAGGFYNYPKNILNTTIIKNEDRQKYSGLLNITIKISSIIVPVILGILLSYMSYINVGKIMFCLFIIMFILSLFINETYDEEKNTNLKGFWKLLKKDKDVKKSVLLPILGGISYSSGVMGLIITLSKINVFKSNINLGFVDSACAVIYLITCVLFAFIKKDKFKKLSYLSGIFGFIILLIYAFTQKIYLLAIYLLIRNSFIGFLNLITNYTTNNISNTKEIKDNKPEYYLLRELSFTISRCFGFILLIIFNKYFGVNNIYYILILSAIAIITNGIVVGNMNEN